MHSLVVTGVFIRYLRHKALGLVFRVIQLGIGVGNLAATDKQLEAVSLKGVANSDEARELAGQLASNTKGVKNVDNQLNVSATATTSAQVQQKANTAGTAINDAWITSKVKSSLVYASNINGLDISVETKSGMVFLSGSVLSSEEKQLAIETVRNIRGVRGVDADAISVDS